MTDKLLPPIGKPKRELLAYMYDGSLLLVGSYRKILRPDGYLNLTYDPKPASIDGLLARNLIAPCAVPGLGGRVMFEKAFQITPEGRAAHEALTRKSDA